jgi:post-segregation antitoxin (ccd killing protein)
MQPTVSIARKVTLNLTLSKELVEAAKKYVTDNAPTYRTMSHLVEIALTEYIKKD